MIKLIELLINTMFVMWLLFPLFKLISPIQNSWTIIAWVCVSFLVSFLMTILSTIKDIVSDIKENLKTND